MYSDEDLTIGTDTWKENNQRDTEKTDQSVMREEFDMAESELKNK